MDSDDDVSMNMSMGMDISGNASVVIPAHDSPPNANDGQQQPLQSPPEAARLPSTSPILYNVDDSDAEDMGPVLQGNLSSQHQHHQHHQQAHLHRTPSARVVADRSPPTGPFMAIPHLGFDTRVGSKHSQGNDDHDDDDDGDDDDNDDVGDALRSLYNREMQETATSSSSKLHASIHKGKGVGDTSILDTSVALSIGPNISFADILEIELPSVPPPQEQHPLLLAAAAKHTIRGLAEGAKWLLELASSLPVVADASAMGASSLLPDVVPEEAVTMMLAKTYFGMNEFKRTAHTLKDCTSSPAVFLRLYSLYLAGERVKEEKEPAPIKSSRKTSNQEIPTIRRELEKRIKESEKPDAFLLYLYGLILRELGLVQRAKTALVMAVRGEPYLWSAWALLVSLCENKSQVNELCATLPLHWMRHHFHAYSALELYAPEAGDMFEALYEHYPSSTWVASSVALAHYNMRDYETAGTIFLQLQGIDPYRLEHIDVYSNILYVQDDKHTRLSELARMAVDVDRYRAETCCVIGNYYSSKGAHERAIDYFQRALKLNRRYLSAWTLLGHEYLELKNKQAAVAAYRRAVAVNPRDFRAWYGLGQTYEFLNMSTYSIYYYKRALHLRPYDVRMWEAVATALFSNERFHEAIRCFESMRLLMKSEGTNTRRTVGTLADLYKRTRQTDKAYQCFEELVELDDSGNVIVTDYMTLRACKFLAHFHMERNHRKEAEKYANVLMSSGEGNRQAAQAILLNLERRARANNHDGARRQLRVGKGPALGTDAEGDGDVRTAHHQGLLPSRLRQLSSGLNYSDSSEGGPGSESFAETSFQPVAEAREGADRADGALPEMERRLRSIRRLAAQQRRTTADVDDPDISELFSVDGRMLDSDDEPEQGEEEGQHRATGPMQFSRFGQREQRHIQESPLQLPRGGLDLSARSDDPLGSILSGAHMMSRLSNLSSVVGGESFLTDTPPHHLHMGRRTEGSSSSNVGAADDDVADASHDDGRSAGHEAAQDDDIELDLSP